MAAPYSFFTPEVKIETGEHARDKASLIGGGHSDFLVFSGGGQQKKLVKGRIWVAPNINGFNSPKFQYQFNKDFRAVLGVIYQDMPSLEQDRVSRNRRVGKNEVEQGAEAPTTK